MSMELSTRGGAIEAAFDKHMEACTGGRGGHCDVVAAIRTPAVGVLCA
jgi:hypothetical protein